jgi:hypothetical protein
MAGTLASEQLAMRGAIETRRGRVADSRALIEERRFYAVASFALLSITVVGFRAFVLHGGSAFGRFTPQIVGLIVVHGLAMLGWVTLLFVQSLLIVNRKLRLHMTLGRLGAGLAAIIVIAGLAAGSLSVHYNPALYDDFGGPRYFLAIMVSEMLTFGGLVAVAIAYRHRPEVHRPLMLLATLAAVGAAMARWPYVPWLRAIVHGNVWAMVYGQALVLGAMLFVLHAAMTRRAYRPYVIGYACLAAVTLLTVLVGSSAAWGQIASLVVP